MAKVKSNKKYDKKINEKKDIKERSFTVKSLSYVILLAIFLFSFYIRGITPLKNVFNRGIVGFAMDDSVFHMRLVENTIQFFPHRIFFDAFTLYPHGNSLHWGPLFDQMIAFFALVAGVFANGGAPSQSVIDTIGAFFPAILGALTVFPVYVIGKELLDEKAGLIGAFLIAILPGQWLSRSVLGFTDNHVAEVFYLTLMMMFFVIAIKKSEYLTFDHWLNWDWAALKTPLIYSILAGISFGAYLLSWTNGVFFAVVFGIFVVVQYIIDHFRGVSTEYLGIVGIISYLVAMVAVLPYVTLSYGFSSYYYSLLHLTVTGGGALVFAFLSLVSREMNKREYLGYHYLLFVASTVLIGIIAIKTLMPSLYDVSVGNWDYIFKPHTGGLRTIAEGSPITPEMIIGNFGIDYNLAYIGILALLYYIVRKSNAEYTLIVVWSVFVLAITEAQNRFAYYYAVNVAILLGFLSSKILDFGDWKNFDSNDIVECLNKIKIQHILSLILVIAVIGFLPSETYYRMTMDKAQIEEICSKVPYYCGNSPYKISTNSAQGGAVDTSMGYYEWYDALNWMRYNTPDPGLNYYDIYEKPKNSTYPYPETAYGVMSWWDYGHIITYWGHRIPNANPFQAGIGGGTSHSPGASTFLTAQTEEQANEVLDKLGINGKPGARYVVSNAYMAYSIQPVFATWNNSDIYGDVVPLSTGRGKLLVPGKKFYDTMESRLHILDANGLKYYRLVHESKPNPNTQGGYLEVGIYNEDNKIIPVCQETCLGKYWYNFVYNGNIPLEYTGYVKIFEYVKGAKITGTAPANATVKLTNTIKTNIERTFEYSQTTTSNGTYVFTVPYSTLGPISGETQFDTKPTDAYTVTVGNVSKQVDVSEKDVLEGNTLTLNLI